jgi:hypothetical protein
MRNSAEGRRLPMARGQKGENIDQRGAEGGIVNGKVRKRMGAAIFLLLISVTFLPSVGYEHFYESVYENPLWFFFLFKFLSENYNYVQVYKTHKLC